MGEKSVLAGAPRETSVRAIHEVSECYHIGRDDLKEVLRYFPEFQKTLELAGRLRIATRSLKKQKTLHIKRRARAKSMKKSTTKTAATNHAATSEDDEDESEFSSRLVFTPLHRHE